MVVGVGKTLFHRLVTTLGSPQKVFQATHRELQGIERLPDKTIDQILGFDVDRNAEREFKLVEAMGAQLLTLEDPDYPELLKTIYDPPPVLYYKGRNPKDLIPSLAVVGTPAGFQLWEDCRRTFVRQSGVYGVVYRQRHGARY